MLFNKGRSEVGVQEQFVVGDFSKLLHHLYKVMILDVYSSWIGYNDESRIELSNLIEEKISDNEPNKIALMIFNIFLCLKNIPKLIIEDTHSDGKDKYVLIKVLIKFVIFVLI